MTVTLEIDDRTHSGKKFLSFLETLGYVSITSMDSKINVAKHHSTNTLYTAMDFLDEWSGAFGQLNDEDLDEVKYNYLSAKYK